MLRRFCPALLVLAAASAANAATLSVAPDKLTYAVGETITLTVTGDDEGAVAYTAFGRLSYSGALVDSGTRSQTSLGPSWLLNPLLHFDNGVAAWSEAFHQYNFNPDTAQNLPGPISTVTLIARAIGVVSVEWDARPNEFLFFGLTDAPGTSFTIVPEPGSSVLLGLGLLGLAANRRRSRRTPCGS